MLWMTPEPEAGGYQHIPVSVPSKSPFQAILLSCWGPLPVRFPVGTFQVKATCSLSDGTSRGLTHLMNCGGLWMNAPPTQGSRGAV